MRTAVLVSLVVAAALVVTGCPKPQEVMQLKEIDYEHQLPPGALALRKITDPALLPDFTQAAMDMAGLREAIQFSLEYMAKPSSQEKFPYGTITHAQAEASLKAMLALLDSGKSPNAINQEIRQNYDVYMSVGCDYRGTVLFTAYYTPIFDASLQKTDRFKYPLYKAPADLVKQPDGTPASPLPERRTIESSHMYDGNELVWLADPFEAYVCQIQGSARLHLPDGQEKTVGYTANNGHDYKSVRAELVKDGKIGKRDGLPAMIAYFKAHPNEVNGYIYRNPRYVFFAPVDDGRPRGCLNEPVTARRSLATDKKIFPPGCLAMVQGLLPQRRGGQVVDAPFSAFALDQDSGGAIRAPGRCDVYLGIGKEAGELAGRAQNEGKLYYVFLKPTAGGTPAVTPTTAPGAATLSAPK